MKLRRHHIFLIVAALSLLCSCTGLEGLLLDDLDLTNNFTTTSQSVSFSADQQTKNVKLTDLKAAIDQVEESSSWVTVTPQSYSSGSPSVIITVTANSLTSSRSATVTITDTNKNRVNLTVSQEGISNKINVIHNGTTDRPAYAPRR